MPNHTITRALRRWGAGTIAFGVAAAVAVAGMAGPEETSAAPTRYVAQVVQAQVPAWGIANLDHKRVDSWLTRFSKGDQRSSMAIYLKRMKKYDGMIEEKLAARGMPQELLYLALIESGFNPTAKSPVKASGLWQFMGATGRQYGLEVSRKRDERNDPAKATDAALDYLSDLHDQFGSWYLAAAAYNTGQGRVSRIMRQTLGRVKGTDADYYRISHRLPQETRDYVPKMIAAARIAKAPAQYGFSTT